MTKDGFTFLVMGFTGKVAAKFKEDYINAFNQMEQYIYSSNNQNQENLISNNNYLKELLDEYKYLVSNFKYIINH